MVQNDEAPTVARPEISTPSSAAQDAASNFDASSGEGPEPNEPFDPDLDPAHDADVAVEIDEWADWRITFPGAPTAFEAILGVAPVASWEDPQQFGYVFEDVAQCIKPDDALTWMLVKDVAASIWEDDRADKGSLFALEEAKISAIDKLLGPVPLNAYDKPHSGHLQQRAQRLRRYRRATRRCVKRLIKS